MLDGILDGIKTILGDTLTTVLEAILNATLFKILYYAEAALCWIIAQLYDMFEVFAGIVRVRYGDQKPDYLINIFFTNHAVSNIYWAMALIGIALTFGFAIWAVVRKMFDADGKQQQSMGQIIGAGLKSFFLIVSMTLIISVVLKTTNTLMEQVDTIFNNAYHLDYSTEYVFSEEEYAAMGRVLSAIGNASVVPNSKNRYNVNLCYNEIRGDMLYLQNRGVFLYSYYQTDQYGNELKSWQSVLAQIARSTDLQYDVKIDVYNQGVMNSVTAAMDYLQSGGNIAPVSYVREYYQPDGKAHLDRMVFLMGTMRAARNTAYNREPSFMDALRGPYYFGEGKSIYNIDDVDSDFNIGFPTDYILVFLAVFALITDLITILLNCVARIFNVLFLYIIAPPVIAAGPLDGGGKFKQWTTAFVVQSLSVFGTVIAMRLLMIYLPIVASPQLVLFEDRPLLNVLSKFMLIFGGFEAAKKSTSLLTGILADSAGWQAVQAGDMSSSAGKLTGAAAGVAKGAAGLGLKAAGGVANFATKPAQNLAKRGWENTGGKWSNLGKADEGKKQAKQSIAVDEAKQKILAERAAKNGGKSGSAPSQPSSQGASGSASSLPSNQSSSGGEAGGGADIPKAPPPPPPPGSPAAQLASKASKMHAAMSKKVDAQGDIKGMKKPEVSMPKRATKSTGYYQRVYNKNVGEFTGKSFESDEGAGNRPSLGGAKSAPAPKHHTEAPDIPRKRPTLDD